MLAAAERLSADAGSEVSTRIFVLGSCAGARDPR